MAIRPVFVVSLDERHCVHENVQFEYFNGFSDKQMQRSIKSLHKAFGVIHEDKKILEISRKSEVELGRCLSAFNICIKTDNKKEISVESAFQASKVFEKGGPYTDLLDVSSAIAKKDERLKTSGNIIAFKFSDEVFGIEPKTYFYNWLYINALQAYTDLTEQILEYDAFTDIAFNPKRSINCQAEAVAIYVSLQKQKLLDEALKSKENFLDIVYSKPD